MIAESEEKIKPFRARVYLQEATARVDGGQLKASCQYVRGERTGRASWEVLNARTRTWIYDGVGPQGPADLVNQVRQDAESALRDDGRATLNVMGSIEVGTVDPEWPREVDATVAACIPVALHVVKGSGYLLCHKAPTTEWADIFQTAHRYKLDDVSVHCPAGSWSEAAAQAATAARVTTRVGTAWESNATWLIGPLLAAVDGPVPGPGARRPVQPDDSVPGAAAGSPESPMAEADGEPASGAAAGDDFLDPEPGFGSRVGE